MRFTKIKIFNLVAVLVIQISAPSLAADTAPNGAGSSSGTSMAPTQTGGNGVPGTCPAATNNPTPCPPGSGNNCVQSSTCLDGTNREAINCGCRFDPNNDDHICRGCNGDHSQPVGSEGICGSLLNCPWAIDPTDPVRCPHSQ